MTLNFDGGKSQVGTNANYPVSVSYKVRKGDTLSTISQATGIPISILAKDNDIKDINKINTGDVIFLNYHPQNGETINSPEMNELFTNPADQAAYFEQMDAATLTRYTQVAQDGAQKHINFKS